MKMSTVPNGALQLNTEADVFLGGSCNPTTWRKDVVIPALEAAGIKYGNPQIEDYSETDEYYKSMGFKNGVADIEALAKANAFTLLFVIDGQTRATASCVEVAELIAVRGEDVVLVINDILDGTEIAGQKVTGRELKDLNGMRKYLREEASRYSVVLCETVEEAVEEVIAR
jgi:hypothetical protein